MYTHACNETHQACQSLKKHPRHKKYWKEKKETTKRPMPNMTPHPTRRLSQPKPAQWLVGWLGYDNAVKRTQQKKEV